jgi:peptidyl-prolyl cis-trans isomerase C
MNLRSALLLLALATASAHVGISLDDGNYAEAGRLTTAGDVWLVYFHGTRLADGKCGGCAAFEASVGDALFAKLKTVRVGHADVGTLKAPPADDGGGGDGGGGGSGGLLGLAGDDALRTPSVALFKMAGGKKGGADPNPLFVLTGAEAAELSSKALAKRIKRALSGLSKASQGAGAMRFQKLAEAAAVPTLATAKHILVKTEAEATALLAQLRAVPPAATFEALAAAHSNCPSGKKGGSLGQFGRGQMVPEFEGPAFMGEIGALIGPIATKFGYHLLMVTARE